MLKSSQRVAEVPSVVATGVGNPPTQVSPEGRSQEEKSDDSWHSSFPIVLTHLTTAIYTIDSQNFAFWGIFPGLYNKMLKLKMIGTKHAIKSCCH
ncbi:hypothetical protein H6G77_16465 [Aulosira sp. FACHB-615]|nr:hypothetical protein [Aulosira sp. FACHB-615]